MFFNSPTLHGRTLYDVLYTILLLLYFNIIKICVYNEEIIMFIHSIYIQQRSTSISLHVHLFGMDGWSGALGLGCKVLILTPDNTYSFRRF